MSDGVYRQNDDGTWSPAEPIPMRGWVGRTEQWLRLRGFRRTAHLFAWWDERGLG